MARRNSVLTLAILSIVFLIASIVIYLIGNMAMVNPYFPAFTQIFDTIIAIIKDMGTYMLPAIIIIVVGAVFVLLGIIELIVNCVRHRVLTGVYFVIAKIVMAAGLVFVLPFICYKDYLDAIMGDLANSWLALVFVGLMILAGVFSLINFIVDMVSGGAKKVDYNSYNQPYATANPYANANPYAQPTQTVNVNVNNNPYDTPAKAEEKVEEPVAEKEPEPVKVEEPVAEKEPEVVAEPEPVKVEEPVKEEKPVEPAVNEDLIRRLEALEKAEEERKTATISKDAVKEAAEAKPAKKPAKKAAKKPAKKQAAKKAEPVEKKTTTIKKDDVKKATVTNEDGVTYGKAFHVAQRKELNKWEVKATGAEKALKLFNTQKEAIEYAEKLAENQGASIRVHSKEGKIRKHFSKVNN